MAPISKKLLLVHQHVHVQTPRGIGAQALAVGAVRLVTDHFARVVSLTPVRSAGPREEVVEFPHNVECKPLYTAVPGGSRVRAALRHVRSLPRIAREVQRADVVYLRLPNYPAFLAGALALAQKKDLMVSIHGNWGEVFLARRKDRPWWRAVAGFVSEYQRFLAARSVVALVTGEHTRVLAGPDAVVFSQHQFTRTDLFERADTCLSRPVKLLYVGLLSRSKGMDELLDALVMLGREGMDCTLRLVGAPSRYDVHGAIARRGLEGRVILSGFVPWGPELFGLYRDSDIFVFPSWSEGLPKAPMEALSQGLPVVATPSGTSAYVRHEDSGLLVPVGDARALARAIARMIGDGQLRRRCIKRGLEVAAEHTREAMQAQIGQALAEAFAAAG